MAKRKTKANSSFDQLTDNFITKKMKGVSNSIKKSFGKAGQLWAETFLLVGGGIFGAIVFIPAIFMALVNSIGTFLTQFFSGFIFSAFISAAKAAIGSFVTHTATGFGVAMFSVLGIVNFAFLAATAYVVYNLINNPGMFGNTVDVNAPKGNTPKPAKGKDVYKDKDLKKGKKKGKKSGKKAHQERDGLPNDHQQGFAYLQQKASNLYKGFQRAVGLSSDDADDTPKYTK